MSMLIITYGVVVEMWAVQKLIPNLIIPFRLEDAASSASLPGKVNV